MPNSWTKHVPLLQPCIAFSARPAAVIGRGWNVIWFLLLMKSIKCLVLLNLYLTKDRSLTTKFIPPYPIYPGITWGCQRLNPSFSEGRLCMTWAHTFSQNIQSEGSHKRTRFVVKDTNVFSDDYIIICQKGWLYYKINVYILNYLFSP